MTPDLKLERLLYALDEIKVRVFKELSVSNLHCNRRKDRVLGPRMNNLPNILRDPNGPDDLSS